MHKFCFLWTQQSLFRWVFPRWPFHTTYIVMPFIMRAKQCWHTPFFIDQAFIPRTYVLKFSFKLFRMLTFVHQKFPSNPNLIFHKSHSRVRSLIKCLAKALMRIFLQFIFTNRAMRLLMMARMLFRHIDAPFEIYLKKQTFYMNRIIYIYLACSYFLPVSANHSNSA